MRWIAASMLTALLLALPTHSALAEQSKTMTIRLVSHTMQSKWLINKPPRQLSQGDVIGEWATLRNDVEQFGRPRGAVVGSLFRRTTNVSVTTTQVKITAKVPRRHT